MACRSSSNTSRWTTPLRRPHDDRHPALRLSTYTPGTRISRPIKSLTISARARRTAEQGSPRGRPPDALVRVVGVQRAANCSFGTRGLVVLHSDHLVERLFPLDRHRALRRDRLGEIHRRLRVFAVGNDAIDQSHSGPSQRRSVPRSESSRHRFRVSRGASVGRQDPYRTARPSGPSRRTAFPRQPTAGIAKPRPVRSRWQPRGRGPPRSRASASPSGYETVLHRDPLLVLVFDPVIVVFGEVDPGGKVSPAP